MDLQRFKNSPVGQLVPITGTHRGREYSHHAFLPNPLPSHIDISSTTWQALAGASLALGRLDGAGRRLPNPQLLARPAIREEAVSTSAIEGTYTTLPAVLQSEALVEEEEPDEDIDQVLSYVRTAELGFAQIQERPVSLGLIKDLHALLVRHDPDVPPDERGEFRRRQNFVGDVGGRVEDARYVPPPPGDQLAAGLEGWERWIHNADIPILIRVALAHYQFEALHPFIDGNGRIGRLVAILMLLEANVLSVPLLNISPYLEERRDRYQDLLLDLSATGKVDEWITFFAEGLAVQSERALEKSEALLGLRDEMVGELRSRRVRGLALQISEDLIGQPVIRVARTAERYNVSYQAAAYAVDRLVREDILVPVEFRPGRRVFVARRVVEMLG